MKFSFFLHCFLVHILSKFYFVLAAEDSEKIHFTNSWAVHIENGDDSIANKIADKHGFINFGQIGSLPGYFHFVHKKTGGRRKRREVDNVETLLSEEKIKWVEQQCVLEREKRSIVPDYVQSIHSTSYLIHDPMYNEQWYLNNVGQSSGPSGLDINVLPVWAQGISGKGVVVAILDDGLDHTHPDLRANYDARASYDFNDYDEDPMPNSKDSSNCHGTKCAGEVAAEAGNDICGVGVAFNSSIGGIRMLDGNVTDTIEGSALSFKKDFIDIYSCAWGPKDDGKRFGRPGTLASKALELGTKEGRNGLGSIFVWATGNGGLTDDDCNCDGYTTSVYTISVGAISDHGLSTYYTESCASTLAVTYSGGSHREKKENKIVTTTLNHKCTDEFKGTSSAAPLAAGIIALALEANGNLTWRDVQHLIVETSLMTSPLDEGWRRNGAGKWFNQKFGFGRMDASALVTKARGWTNVNNLRTCWSDKNDGPWSIPSGGTVLIAMNVSACADTNSEVKSLEHVQVVLSLKHRHRGRVSIELISPSGTRTQLLKTRRNDKSTKGLKDWVFMSVHFWGEDPKGVWTLAVTENENNGRDHHRTKSKFGDFEDATEAFQDEMESKAGKDAEHESIVDDDDLFKSSEEFENNVFKDDTYAKKKEEKKMEDKPKNREKNDKLHMVKRKKKTDNKMKHFGKHRGVKKKKKTSEEEVADEIVEELLKGAKNSKLDQYVGTEQNRTKQISKAGQSNTTNKLLNQNNTHIQSNETNRGSNLSRIVDAFAAARNTSYSNEENTMLESLLKTVLSEVFTNFRSEDGQGSKFEQRLRALETVLFKNETKPIEETLSSILMKALKDGKAIDKINNVLVVLENSKNQTKFVNTSFYKNSEVVADVLKVLKDILSSSRDDKNVQSYKKRISRLLETSSNSTRKLREKLFNDLEPTADGKDVSPSVINDALMLISHIFRRKNRKKSTHFPSKIQILLKGSDDKVLLPASDVTSSEGNRHVVTTTTTSSQEIHHNSNGVDTITVEHVDVRKNPTGNNQDQHKTDVVNSQNEQVDGFRQHLSRHKEKDESYDNGERQNHGEDMPDENRRLLAKNTASDDDDTSGFTIAIMKNGKKIEERKVDNAQARNYLQRHDTDVEKTRFENPDRNIDVEVSFDKERKQNMRRHNKHIEFDVTPTGALVKPEFDNNLEKDDDVMKLEYFKPSGRPFSDRRGNMDDDLIPKLISSDTPNKKNNLEKKKRKPRKMVKKKRKKLKKYNEDDGEEFNLQNAFPFLQFADPHQLAQIPTGENNENFVQQLYNPFSSNRFPNFEDLPPLEEEASFYNYPNVFENSARNHQFESDRRSRVSLPSFEDMQKLRESSTKDVKPEPKRSHRRRRSVLNENQSAEDELYRPKRSDIIDDVESDDNDEDGPHVVKRSAIFSELYPSKRSSFVDTGAGQELSPTKKYRTDIVKDTAADKRSAVKKALSLEGTLKQKLFSMKKESSSVLNIMKRVHDDIAVGDSTDLRMLEKQLSKLESKSSVSIAESNALKDIENEKDSLVRAKVFKKPNKIQQDPDEYYKYGAAASGQIETWTIKFYGT